MADWQRRSPAMFSQWQAGARHGLRSFSTSASARAGIVSNIGRQPISIPPSVTVSPSRTEISVKGPLGETIVPLMPFVKLSDTAPNTLSVSVENPKERKQRAMWGLTRTLIQNAIVGMTEGFTTPVYLVGVGYRAALEADPRGQGDGRSGQRLNMKLGYSHPVFVPIPDHIKAEVPLPTKIVLSCTDKHKLGLFAAQIRTWRPPEPYKGKVRRGMVLALGCAVAHAVCVGYHCRQREDKDEDREEEVDLVMVAFDFRYVTRFRNVHAFLLLPRSRPRYDRNSGCYVCLPHSLLAIFHDALQ